MMEYNIYILPLHFVKKLDLSVQDHGGFFEGLGKHHKSTSVLCIEMSPALQFP